MLRAVIEKRYVGYRDRYRSNKKINEKDAKNLIQFGFKRYVKNLYFKVLLKNKWWDLFGCFSALPQISFLIKLLNQIPFNLTRLFSNLPQRPRLCSVDNGDHLHRLTFIVYQCSRNGTCHLLPTNISFSIGWSSKLFNTMLE